MPPRSRPTLLRPRTLASLGAAVIFTILLSWTIAAFSDVSKSTLLRDTLKGGSLAGMRVYVPRDWTPRTWLVSSGPGIREDLISECIWEGSTIGASPETAPNRTRRTISVGWPLAAMQWAAYEENRYATTLPWSSLTPADAWRGGLPQWGSFRSYTTGQEKRFPIRPTPIGFAVDVALFTLAAWWAMEWLTRTRAARRAKAGRCEACGYDLAGLQKCPECGTATATQPPQNTPAATIPP